MIVAAAAVAIICATRNLLGAHRVVHQLMNAAQSAGSVVINFLEVFFRLLLQHGLPSRQ